jgi:hypothetical protein
VHVDRVGAVELVAGQLGACHIHCKVVRGTVVVIAPPIFLVRHAGHHGPAGAHEALDFAVTPRHGSQVHSVVPSRQCDVGAASLAL